MAGVRHIQSNGIYIDKKEKIKLEKYASLMGLFAVLDGFSFKYDGNIYKITAYISIYKNDFEAKEMYELIPLMGEWLVKLPKSIWKEKQ